MAAAKKAASKAKDTSKWVVMEKDNQEAYTIYTSEAKAIAAAKEMAEEASSWNDRDITIMLFKLDREVKFVVEVKEVPVMTKQRTVKERSN
jgi:hypothetical protein